jgi:hypothetical protein
MILNKRLSMIAPQQATIRETHLPGLVDVVMSPNPALAMVITVKKIALSIVLKSSIGGSKHKL